MAFSSSIAGRDPRSLRRQLEEDDVINLGQDKDQDVGGGITIFIRK